MLDDDIVEQIGMERLSDCLLRQVMAASHATGRAFHAIDREGPAEFHACAAAFEVAMHYYDEMIDARARRLNGRSAHA